MCRIYLGGSYVLCCKAKERIPATRTTRPAGQRMTAERPFTTCPHIEENDMTRDTQIGSKLAAQGVLPRNVRLQIALAEFQNNGGEYGVALAMLNAAYGKGREGHMTNASRGQSDYANAPRRHDDGKGQIPNAGKATTGPPNPSSPKRNEAGHQAFAAKAVTRMPRPVSSLYIAAAKKGAKAIALTVLDSFKVRDGRALGDLRFGELETLRMDNAQEAAIIRQIQRHAANVSPDTKVRDVINAETLERMIQRGAEVAHV
jgi:hypothetical protein